MGAVRETARRGPLPNPLRSRPRQFRFEEDSFDESNSLTDAEVLAPADVLDWWIPSRAHPERVRTLLETVAWAAEPNADRITPFRPPSGGVACAWILPDQVAQVCAAG